MKRSTNRSKQRFSSKPVYPEVQFFKRNWFILIIILFISNFAIKRAVDLRFFAQSCMSNTQIQNDTRCLYIYNGNVYEKGSRSNPHHGHACGSNVTQLLSTVPFHLNNIAVYLDPNLVGSVCPAQQPTPTPTVAAPTMTPIPTALPSTTPTPTRTPSPTPTRIPSSTPTIVPTVVPTAIPTMTPTTRPLPTSTMIPTRNPTTPTLPTTIPTIRPTLRPTAIATQPPFPTPTQGGSRIGDLNYDGCVDQKDIQIFIKAIKENPKNPSLDLNGNKKTDFGDLYIIMENEGNGCKRNTRIPWWRKIFKPFEREIRDDE